MPLSDKRCGVWSGPGGWLRKPVAAAGAVTVVGGRQLPRPSADLGGAPDTLQRLSAIGCFVLKRGAGCF